MIKEEQLAELGSTDLIGWMRESMERVEKRIKNIFDENTDVFHIRLDDIDSFKKQVESYAKEHPDADIKASAFIVSSNPKKNKEYKYESE